VRAFNTPPGISYFVNYAPTMSSTSRDGAVGDVAVYRVDCTDPACYVEPGTSVVTRPLGGSEPTGTPTPSPSTPSRPRTPIKPGGDPPCAPGDPGCGQTTTDDECLPGDPKCDEQRDACFKADGEVVCDPQLGWIVKLVVNGPGGLNIDTIEAYSRAPASVSVGNGPVIPVTPPAIIALSGANGGDAVNLEVCGYNAAAAATGEPYDCCRARLVVKIPNGTCRPAAANSGQR
jgi:hypothetical protein